MKKIYFIVLVMLVSCGTNKNKPTNTSVVNTVANKQYEKSRKTFVGNLNTVEYNNLKVLLEQELQTSIPVGKLIIITYVQKAPNCIMLDKSIDVKAVINKQLKILSTISSEHNTINFNIYTSNCANQNIYQKNESLFRLDSGFFYTNVFTLHENCEAFLAVKPNGDFMKLYGGDYINFLHDFIINK
uniref:hypothetical protein n=1 Tax=Flavobacterium sp. TaxID=239 RepID=UPI0040492EFF